VPACHSGWPFLGGADTVDLAAVQSRERDDHLPGVGRAVDHDEVRPGLAAAADAGLEHIDPTALTVAVRPDLKQRTRAQGHSPGNKLAEQFHGASVARRRGATAAPSGFDGRLTAAADGALVVIARRYSQAP